MRRATSRLVLGTVLAAVLAGCAGKDLYQTSQGFRRAQCERILEADRRADCMRNADRDWESYERDRERARR
jgi:hypothetical protein